jgi:AraC-like DNA-binding protein
MNTPISRIPPRNIRLAAKASANFEPQDATACCATRSARETWAPGFCARNEESPEGGIVQVLAGQGWFHDGRDLCPVGSGWVFFWAPGQGRAFGCTAATMSVAIVNLQGPWERFLTRAFGTSPAARLHPEPLAGMELLDRVHDWALRAEPDGGRMAGNFLQACCLELRNRLAETGSADSRRDLWLQSRRLIVRSGHRIATVEDLSAELGVSVSYLSRLYRLFDQQTPGGLLRRCRMTHAAGQIRQGLSLSQVAQRLGYADQSSFGKAFAREMGLSPARYRRRAVEGQGSQSASRAGRP